MHRIWRPSARARSCEPTARAVCPPMPASTSSNTSVASAPSWATPMSASMTRESSPPEAISRSGPAGTPALGAMRNSTESAPAGPGSRSCRAISKLAPSMASSARRSRTARASRGAAFARVARSAPAAVAWSARAASSSAMPRSSATSAPASSSRRDAAALGVGEDVGDRAAVLALQALEHGQALLGGLQRARIAVEALGVAQQLAGQVVGLVGQRAPPLGQRVEPGVDARHAVEPSAAGGQERDDARPVLGRHRLRGAQRRGAQRLEVAQALARAEQLVLLVLRRVGRLDLLQLEGEQVELALARAGALAQLRQRRLELAHAHVGRRERRAARQVRRAAEAVEDLQLRGGEHELAMLVLAVERQQRDGHLAQVADGRRAPAQVGARAPLGAHAPGEHDLLGVGGQALAELAAQRVRQLEDALHVGLRRAGTHDPRPWRGRRAAGPARGRAPSCRRPSRP